MKKLGAILIIVAALGAAWFVVREKAARDNAADYLKAKEIPTYHLLSFHRDSDRNLLGYCKPCGEKAATVIKDELKGELDKVTKGK